MDELDLEELKKHLSQYQSTDCSHGQEYDYCDRCSYDRQVVASFLINKHIPALLRKIEELEGIIKFLENMEDMY